MSYEESLKSINLDVDSSLGFYTGVPGLPGSTDPNYGRMYRFVKVVSPHTVGMCTAAGDLIVGILQNKPQVAGQAGTVGIFGVSNITAGAAITAGDRLVPDSTGRAVQGGAGTWLALASATVANELIPALKL